MTTQSDLERWKKALEPVVEAMNRLRDPLPQRFTVSVDANACAAARQTLAEIDAAIADAQAGDGWRTMDSAPRDGSPIVSIGFRTEPRIVKYVAPLSSRSPGWWATAPGRWDFRPTHWMPLPPPPTAAPASSASTKEVEG